MMKKILVLVLISTIINAEADMWKPLETFIEHIKKNTDQVEAFVKQQETKFIENVSTNTKEVKKFVANQEKKVGDSFSDYYKSIKNVNNDFHSYFKKKEDEMKTELQNYVLKNQAANIFQQYEQTGPDREKSISNPDTELSVPAMIASRGYPCESHTVVTQDGYILTLHRIPRGKDVPGYSSSKTVLLHHGLFGSSADWLIAGPNKSLGYLLAEAGYDVWMANVRGNRYSREHTKYKTESFEYWNFSWHEVAVFDLPAVIDYIENCKGNKSNINYIGHSMGTTILFVLLSIKPEYNTKLNAGFALAPVVYLSDVKTPIKSLAPYASNIGFVSNFVGSNEFKPKKTGLDWLGDGSCDGFNFKSGNCENIIFMVSGFDNEQLNDTVLQVFLAHFGTGTSTKTIVHFAQEISAGGRFQQFDYGPMQNLDLYGSTFPPEYSLQNVTLPIELFYSMNDWLSGESDVERLYENLESPKDLFLVPLEKFNHLDFLMAVDVKELLYNKLFESLRRWNE